MATRVHYRHDGYSIGQVAIVLGIPVSAINRCVETGLLTPTRTRGGHRRFDTAQVARVSGIVRTCSSCGEVCFWHDTDWVCESCGDEWNSDHDPRFAAPGEED